ncbi:MAG: sulfurtransferase [Gammaproteobacteria bacterium]
MQQLISTGELNEQLGATDLVVVDCRFNLMEPAAGRRAWGEGHIPGAFYAHLDEELAGAIGPDTGRHPLPEMEDFAKLLGNWGISPASRVVAYDDAGGAMAARLWWLLRWVGHDRVMLLDGGLPAWEAAGFALEQTAPEMKQGNYPVKSAGLPVIDVATVQSKLAGGQLVLIDARDAQRFAGEVEPIDAQAGHVPGALNRPFQENLDESGCFLPPEELHAGFSGLLTEHEQNSVACMCGSGVTACHNLFAIHLAGLDINPSLYVGSWSEWIRDPQRPCEPATA